GRNLLRQAKWTEAEPVLRDCLALREQVEPNAWTMFQAQAMLGEALFGQKKYADAEPLLRKGCEGLTRNAAELRPPGRVTLTEAVGRLIALYEATGNKGEAARWQAKLGKAKTP